MNRVRLGLVGLGRWGRNYLRVLQEIESAELVVCCDRNVRRVKEASSSAGGVEMVCGLSAVLADDIDAVVVSTPASTHYEITKMALEHGKHVLVEKPTATSYLLAEDLHRRADRAKLHLRTGLLYLHHPAVAQMKDLMDAGGLGELRFFHSQRTALGPIRDDVSALFDLAPHDLSILLYLIDRPPASIIGHGISLLKSSREDLAWICLDFGDGFRASIHVGWLDATRVRRTTLVGSKGIAVYDEVLDARRLAVVDEGVDTLKSPPPTWREATGGLKGVTRYLPVSDEEPLRVQCEEFLTAIQANGINRPRADFELRVMRALEMAALAIDRDRKQNLSHGGQGATSGEGLPT